MLGIVPRTAALLIAFSIALAHAELRRREDGTIYSHCDSGSDGAEPGCEAMAAHYKEALCRGSGEDYQRSLQQAREQAKTCVGYGWLTSSDCVALRDAGETAVQAALRLDRGAELKNSGDIDYFLPRCLGRAPKP